MPVIGAKNVSCLTPFNDSIKVHIISEFDADMTITKINEIDEELDSIDQIVKKEISYLKEWEDSEAGKLNRKRDYLMQVLETYMLINNKRKLNLPHGRASYRKQPFKVDIKDENLLMSQGYFREKQILDKKSIMDNFKKTGEIPNGCDIIRHEEKLYVKPTLNGKE